MKDSSLKNDVQVEKIKRNQVLRLIAVQVIVFSGIAIASYLMTLPYSLALIVVGAILLFVLLPWNTELLSYGGSAPMMMHHGHNQALEQMRKEQARWYDNFFGLLYGVIPIVGGIVIDFIV